MKRALRIIGRILGVLLLLVLLAVGYFRIKWGIESSRNMKLAGEAAPMLTEDALDVGDFGAFDGGGAMAPGMAINPGAVGALPEQPYTVWQVASLGLVLFLLLVGGMVGYDLARNLWLPEDQIVSGGVLKLILGLLGGG